MIGDLRRRARVSAAAVPSDVLHGNIPRPDQALLEKEIRRNLGASVDAFLRSKLSPRLAKYLDALLIELQLDDARWGLQERVAERTGRSKSRVSEAVATIRALARAHDIEELIADAKGDTISIETVSSSD